MEKNKKKQNLRNTFNATKYMLGFIWRGDKKYIFLKGIMVLLNAILPLSYITMPGFIINELSGSQRVEVVFAYIAVLLVVPILNHFINLIINRYVDKLAMELNLKFEAEYFHHTLGMDLEYLETPEVTQMKYRAMDIYTNTLSIVDRLGTLFTAIFRIVALSAIIFTLNPIIILMIFLVVYINSLITKWANFQEYLLSKEKGKYDRFIYGLANWLREGVAGCLEIRLLNIKEMFIDIVVDKKRTVNKLTLKSNANWSYAGLLNTIIGFIQQSLLYVYLVYLVIVKGLAIGSFTIYLSTIEQFTNSLNNVMQSFLELAKTSLGIQDFKKFMEIPLSYQISGDMIPVFDKNSTIEFKNVSFKYPNSDVYALRNMNLVLRANEKLCIVGVNGSGKSTFIKLLTRLYRPTEGEILLNGVNINEYDIVKYQSLFSPVFQDFALYWMTLSENIVLEKEFDEKKLLSVMDRSGLTPLLNKLPAGYNAHLYSYNQWDEENSFSPSGGEGQRIAIARAVYHNSAIFLLDEPTAAIDPVAEYQIYTQFNEMITDKCAVLITHRLSAVQLADKVAVFENGSLKEYGTHQQLYEKNGTYADMFNKQAKFYVDGTQAYDQN